MIVNYWAGIIAADQILPHPKHWAMVWANRAREAQGRGHRLVVFEVPDKQHAVVITEFEERLQDEFGNLPPGLIMP